MRFLRLVFDPITCLLVGAFLYTLASIRYAKSKRLDINENPYI